MKRILSVVALSVFLMVGAADANAWGGDWDWNWSDWDWDWDRRHGDTTPGTTVPEPSSALVFGIGSLIVGGAVRRRNRR